MNAGCVSRDRFDLPRYRRRAAGARPSHAAPRLPLRRRRSRRWRSPRSPRRKERPRRQKRPSTSPARRRPGPSPPESPRRGSSSSGRRVAESPAAAPRSRPASAAKRRRRFPSPPAPRSRSTSAVRRMSIWRANPAHPRGDSRSRERLQPPDANGAAKGHTRRRRHAAGVTVRFLDLRRNLPVNLFPPPLVFPPNRLEKQARRMSRVFERRTD
jgi:hypothetical protein